MTLILTELSPLGIAMAADSAITKDFRKPDGTLGEKVYYGAQKLFVVPKLGAGIAYWGWVHLPQPDSGWESDEEKQDLIELWLPYFLDNNKECYNSIAELAQLLEKELRERIPGIDIKEYEYGNGGMHLAGYESVDSKLLPTFWHIHNGKSIACQDKPLDPTLVNANNDIPPGRSLQLITEMEAKEWPLIIRNGDIGPYIDLWTLLFTQRSPFSEILRQKAELTFPYASTLARKAEFLKFQIETVAGIYQFSKEGKGIGSPITTLTISPTRIITYSPV